MFSEEDIFFLKENLGVTYTPLSVSPASNVFDKFLFISCLLLLFKNFTTNSVYAMMFFSLVTLLLTATFGSVLSLPICYPHLELWNDHPFHPHFDLSKG